MGPTAEERTLAALSHGFGILGMVVSAGFLGWLAPLVIYLTQKDKSRFVAYHAFQALIFQGVLFLLGIVITIIGILTCGFGFLLFVPVAIAAFVFHALAGIKAYEGSLYALPVAGDIARRNINP